MPSAFHHGLPLLTADAMREADRYTMDEYGIPSFTLMESAGRGCADRIRHHYGPFADAPVVVLCGKGNNGGDGLVVARQLLTFGASVHVVLLAAPNEMSEDAARNFTLLQKRSEHVRGRLRVTKLESVDALRRTIRQDRPPALVVDALLGTGLTSNLREPVASLVAWVNDQPAPVVALDLPTGLQSDTGQILGNAVRADRTVTMAARKTGLVTGRGPDVAGAIDVVEIGIPPFVLDRVAGQSGCARLTTDAYVRAAWPDRSRDAYKYSVGMALVVGGAPEFSGAPTMSAQAATRSGAGYVACAVPSSVQPSVASKLTSVPVHGLPVADDGGIDPDAAPEVLSRLADRAGAALLGPGLGRAASTQAFVCSVLASSDLPLVVDADALFALADRVDELTQHADGRWILTPHAGEFQRLAGDDVDVTDRIQVAQEYAARWNSVLLLKGAPSVAAAPDGRTVVGAAGTSALATAGTGDVLAGQCAGLLAQGLDPLDAAAVALHLGARAAHAYASTHDPRTMTAPDLIDHLSSSNARSSGTSSSNAPKSDAPSSSATL